MKGPFPGMDPYLEAHWGDVHTRLVTYASDQIQAKVPGDLRARVEEQITVHTVEIEERDRLFVPDVLVVERPGGLATQPEHETSLTVVEPLLVPIELEERTHRWVEIIDRTSGNRVVTAIEFLSPTNNFGDGCRKYHKKQQELLDGGVNLVEIDLLRAGGYMLAAPPHEVPDTYKYPYRISVVRATNRWQAEVYRTSLREPLPAIRIPLRPSDDDVRLDLQSLIDQSYSNGGYNDIDYRRDPEPPLVGNDAAWADSLLKEKQLRP